ncbi:hypothetical protein RRG08_034869 [Elysia crispata]|uniref:Uncharacterized protein n=1 Tax=Elysia crispata TaxID=231223 RepID=A0AAE1AM85_9GAST|nr:hypothetical protein RRG08_034869 [Elysia crispata]
MGRPSLVIRPLELSNQRLIRSPAREEKFLMLTKTKWSEDLTCLSNHDHHGQIVGSYTAPHPMAVSCLFL